MRPRPKIRSTVFLYPILYQNTYKIQSFLELEIDAMCCVWPDERGYLYIYRCCGASGGGGGRGGGGSMMGIDMCKSYYAWISQQ